MKKVNGIIEQINFKQMAQPDQFDNNFRRSMKVDGEWYAFGACKTDKWNIKVGTGFKELGVGSEVFFVATEREYNGKTYYDAKPSALTVIQFVEPTAASRAPAQQVQRAASPAPTTAARSSNNDGIRAGNGFNAAAHFCAKNPGSDFYNVACDFIDAADALKKAFAHVGDDYTVGARVGMALLFAAQRSNTVDEAIQIAGEALNDIIPSLVEYAKTGTRQVVEEAPKPTVRKAAAKKPAPVVEAVEDVDDEFDDSVPF